MRLMLFAIRKRLFVQHEEKTFCAFDSYHSKRAPLTMSDLTNLIKSETYGEQSLNHQRHFQIGRRSEREVGAARQVVVGPSAVIRARVMAAGAAPTANCV